MEERMILMFVMVMILNNTTCISMSKVTNVSSIGFQENLAPKGVCKEVEEKALIQFYNATFNKKEDLETFMHHREGIKNCCHWDGVTCDAHGSIVSIQFESYAWSYVGKRQWWPITLAKLQSLQAFHMHGFYFEGRPLPPAVGLLPQSLLKLAIVHCVLAGPVPWAGLANLSSLTHLNLSFNYLSNSFHQFSNLTSLTHLDLSTNELEGHFPDCVSLLPHLSYLDLSYNALSGYIPRFWNSTSFIHLDLGKNRALERSGNHDFISSSEICNFTNLQYLGLGRISFRGQALPACLLSTMLPHLSHLDLHDNQFVGQIPPWNSSSSQLSFLDLSNNYLHGPFPNVLAFFSLQSLYLDGNNLTGSIPESLPNLMPKLSELDLSRNRISGTISQIQWEKLPQLILLDLSGNQISGTISQIQWEKLLNLFWLNLSHTQLSGTLPASLGQLFTTATGFYSLDLSHNNMTGNLEWGTQSGKGGTNKILHLSHNLLSGSIPRFFNCGLISVDLSSNFLSGQIPTGLCSGNPELVFLRLAYNNLSGSIPHDLHHCIFLSSLVLHNNHFTGLSTPAGGSNLSSSLQVLNLAHNHLEGSIPMWLQQMYALRVLQLDYNNLSGPLPLSPWNTSQLQVLGLSHNNLSGVIPPESLSLLKGFVYNLSRNVEDDTTLYEESSIHAKGQDMNFKYIFKATVSLDLSYNGLHGPIPNQLGSLTGLVFLNLSHNNLEGSIPKSLSSLTQLQSLDLSSNYLEGNIPSDLCPALTFLAFVNVSNNQLRGRIPGCPQWCTFNSSSFQGNRDLRVPPDGEQCASPDGGKSPTVQEQQPAADEGMNEFLVAVVVGVCISFPFTVILAIFWTPLSQPVRIMSRKLRATVCG